MNTTNHHSPSEHETPEDLRGLSGALDQLAHAERHAAPASLEDRVFAASRAALNEGTPPVIARIGGPAFAMNGWRFRLAASVMIAAVGVAAAVWVNARSSGVPTGGESAAQIQALLESDLEAWTAESSSFANADAELASLHTSLSAIESDGGTDPWDALELSDQEPSL